MKPRQIRRGIESRHTRELGNAPKLGRVSRMRDSGGKSSRRRSADSPVHRNQRMVLTIVSALAALMVVLAGVWVGFRFRSRFQPSQLPTAAKINPEEHVRIASKVKSPSEDEAIDLVVKALESTDEMTAASRMRLQDTSAADAIRFLEESKSRGIDRKRMQWIGSLDIEGLLIEGVQIQSAQEQDEMSRTAFLVPDEQGIWKLDFDSFARVCKPDWKTVLDGQPAPAMVRVLAAPDVYYNGQFADESQWRCFGITSPDCYEHLPEEKRLMYAYCRKNTAQSRALERVLSSEGRVFRLTLEIMRAGQGDKLQFEILRVLSEDWVMTDKPFDERFR